MFEGAKAIPRLPNELTGIVAIMQFAQPVELEAVVAVVVEAGVVVEVDVVGETAVVVGVAVVNDVDVVVVVPPPPLDITPIAPSAAAITITMTIIEACTRVMAVVPCLNICGNFQQPHILLFGMLCMERFEVIAPFVWLGIAGWLCLGLSW